MILFGFSGSVLQMKNIVWIATFLSVHLAFMAGVYSQDERKEAGIYNFPPDKGFSYARDRSFGENYVFENTGKSISIYLIKIPLAVKGKSTLNTQLYESLLSLYNMGFYQEKGKSASYRLKFLNNKKGNFSWYGRVKELKSKEKVYLLFYTEDNLLYRILIIAETGKKDPPGEAKDFLESIILSYQSIKIRNIGE